MIENSYSLNLSTKEAQKNVDELNKSFELQADLVDKLEKELQDYESELKSLTGAGGKTLKQRSELNKKIAQARKGLREEKQGLKDVKTERIKSNKVLKEATKNQADYSGVLDFVDSKTGGIIGKMGKFTKVIGSATKGFNLLRVAIIGTGIGALLIAVTSLTAAFTSNEKGQKKLKRIMAAIGVVVGNLVDIFAKLGNGIISVFEDPQQAVKDFSNLIKEQITNRFNAVIKTAGFLGTAFKKLFERDFSGAMDAAKNAGSSLVDAMTGVEDSVNKATDAVTGFIDEQVREANIMSGIMDKKEKAAKLERDLIVERSTLEGQIADLRLKARKKDEVGAEERKQALLDANALQQQLLDKETEALILKRDAIIAQNELSGSTTADLDAEAEAIAAVNLQIRKKADAERSVQRELNAINTEIKAADDAKIADDKAKAQKIIDDAKQAAKDLAALKLEIRDAEVVTEDEQRELEILKLTEHYDNLIALAQKAGLDTVGLEKAKGDKINEINAEVADKNKEIAQKEADAKKATFDAVASGLQSLSAIAGEETVAGKAFAIAAATINTFRGVSDALAATTVTPFETALKFANAAAIGIAGIANVKKIVSVKTPKVKGMRGGAAAAGAIPTPPTAEPPAFNIVGASETNQLADAIGDQTQVPTKAFVVASDVSTAQEMDRNIIEGASIG